MILCSRLHVCGARERALSVVEQSLRAGGPSGACIEFISMRWAPARCGMARGDKANERDVKEQRVGTMSRWTLGFCVVCGMQGDASC